MTRTSVQADVDVDAATAALHAELPAVPDAARHRHRLGGLQHRARGREFGHRPLDDARAVALVRPGGRDRPFAGGVGGRDPYALRRPVRSRSA